MKIHVLLAVSLVLSCYLFANDKYPATSNGSDPRNLIEVNAVQSSKLHRIRLYEHKGSLYFSAEGESGKSYQLFLFDMDSKLVSQTAVRNREKRPVTACKKGHYLYQVFIDDNLISNGSIVVNG